MSTKPSEITKRYSHYALLFHLLSVLVLLLPLAYYAVLGFIHGETVEKFTLGCTFAIACCLVAANVIFKYHIRSTVWVLVLGIYFCLDNIQTLLIMVAVGTILDEFVLTPLYKSYSKKAGINREIDKRLNG